MQYIDSDDIQNIEYSNENLNVVVINDIKGNTDIGMDNWKFIKNKVDNNKNFNCFYLGEKHNSALVELGYCDESDIGEEDLSILLLHEENKVIVCFSDYEKGMTEEEMVCSLLNGLVNSLGAYDYD